MNAPTPESCPRYAQCSANICPLDADWRKRSHLAGEPVCGLLRELVKPDGVATLATTLPAELVATVADALPEISASNCDIRHKLAQSSRTGSRIKAAQRMRGTVDAREGAPHQQPAPLPVQPQGATPRSVVDMP